MGTNQFANPDEQPLPTDATDYSAIYQQRLAELAAYRLQRTNPNERSAALASLSAASASDAEHIVDAAVTAAMAGATLGELTQALRSGGPTQTAIKPLPSQRASEPYEALRDDARRLTAEMGQQPTIFLANLGPLRQHKARADFAHGFFEPGGFSVISPPGFADWQEAADAALASGAAAVIICSSDDTYPELVPPLARGIKGASPETAVFVAGRPGEQESDYRAAGVDDFIYIGADCLAVNRWLLDRLNMEAR